MSTVRVYLNTKIRIVFAYLTFHTNNVTVNILMEFGVVLGHDEAENEYNS